MLLAVVGSDAYKWLLAFHILLAVVWVGSNTAIQIFVIRAKRAGADRIAYFASEIEWYGTRVLIPSSLTLLILGFILLHESSGAYDLGQGWVTFGIRRLAALVHRRRRLSRDRNPAGSARWPRSAVPRTPSISAGSPGSSSSRGSSCSC